MQRLRPEHNIDEGRASHDGLALLAGDTTPDTNQQVRIGQFQIAHPAQVVKYFFLCPLAHRTGIEQDQIGVLRPVGQLVAFCVIEHIGHLVRVVLVHLTAESAKK